MFNFKKGGIFTRSGGGDEDDRQPDTGGGVGYVVRLHQDDVAPSKCGNCAFAFGYVDTDADKCHLRNLLENRIVAIGIRLLFIADSIYLSDTNAPAGEPNGMAQSA